MRSVRIQGRRLPLWSYLPGMRLLVPQFVHVPCSLKVRVNEAGTIHDRCNRSQGVIIDDPIDPMPPSFRS
eukprot:scaffold16931_cov136-Isochrysis_galbana.AAC.1